MMSFATYLEVRSGTENKISILLAYYNFSILSLNYLIYFGEF